MQIFFHPCQKNTLSLQRQILKKKDMIQGLFSVDEVAAMIDSGDSLLLAGDAALLKALPKGKWIGGVTCRFIEKGKELVTTREKIFAHRMTDVAADVKLSVYDPSDIRAVYDDAFDNGFSVLILPFASEVANEYVYNCVNYSNFASRALCGWISVAPIFSDFERNDVSLVFSGESGESYANAGVAMHIALPPDKYAEVHTFTPLVPHGGDVIVFEENGQQVENVLVNGVRQSFRQYMLDSNIDRSPDVYTVLAGDYNGIVINSTVSWETEKDAEKYVTFGSPVYKDIPYRFAKLDSGNSYVNMKHVGNENVFSLSCITNYVFPDVFLKYLNQTNGPFAYGEIAYFVLNHSTVYVTVGNSLN